MSNDKQITELTNLGMTTLAHRFQKDASLLELTSNNPVIQKNFKNRITEYNTYLEQGRYQATLPYDLNTPENQAKKIDNELEIQKLVDAADALNEKLAKQARKAEKAEAKRLAEEYSL